MSNYRENETHWSDGIVSRFLYFAASGYVPASWFEPALPAESERAAKTGQLNIEIVSHCWRYAHLLNYQLSSLVHYPPTQCHVTMTVFFSPEDEATIALLDHFKQIDIPNITWNWVEITTPRLFRRAIGRNQAAKNSKADWVWFTDCDLTFGEGCLDALNEALQGRTDTLVFPQQERISELLSEEDPMLSFDKTNIELADIDTNQFSISERKKATGPLQITHGDIARHSGYCDSLGFYQRPCSRWRKTYEDRAYRWLIGSHGTPIQVPNVYRICHIVKGRYTGSETNTKTRQTIRKIKKALGFN